MSKQIKLSRTMEDALKTIAAWGGVAYRWPGGFWIGTIWRPGVPEPDWSSTKYLTKQTLRALAERKLLDVIVGEHEHLSYLDQFRLPLRDPFVLELLITEYQTAINAEKFDGDRIGALCAAVEAEADRIHYTNHQRLARIHTQAETFGIVAKDGKCDWEQGRA